jgi:hypothetical protein
VIEFNIESYCTSLGSCGLYYKHTTIINYASSIVNKLETLLTEDTSIVIYDRHMFIVQATGPIFLFKISF